MKDSGAWHGADHGFTELDMTERQQKFKENMFFIAIIKVCLFEI